MRPLLVSSKRYVVLSPLPHLLESPLTALLITDFLHALRRRYVPHPTRPSNLHLLGLPLPQLPQRCYQRLGHGALPLLRLSSRPTTRDGPEVLRGAGADQGG